MGRYYEIDDLAKMFDVHPQTIKREIKRNNLNYFKVGKEIRFTQEHINEYTNIKKYGKTTREIELESQVNQLNKRVKQLNSTLNLIKNQIISIS